jgi:hypothetical protein
MRAILIAAAITGTMLIARPAAAAADTIDQADAHCLDLMSGIEAGTADQKDPVTQYCMGRVVMTRSGNPADAMAHMRQSAEAGYAPAQIILGLAYETGDGVDKDANEARKWLLLAAQQGVAEAENDYGILVYYGHGVPADPAEAVPWFRKAADQGYANSQTMLGEAYRDGKGVPQDYKEAVRLYNLAAAQGHPFAMFSLGLMYLDGEGVSKDEAAGVAWLQKAAERGLPSAQIRLAKCYASGRGVARDDVVALMWLEIAAAKTGHRNPMADELEKRMSADDVAKAKGMAAARSVVGGAGGH